jgi:hypothetical protein
MFQENSNPQPAELPEDFENAEAVLEYLISTGELDTAIAFAYDFAKMAIG